jgi:ATP phosphoribosyltransferase
MDTGKPCEPVLRLAVQKQGRLNKDSIALVQACGIRVNRADNKLKAPASNFPIELLYLRDDDIPAYVADGVADVGIVGENLVVEKHSSVETLRKLGFASCRLSLAVPREMQYEGLQSLHGKTVATTYPNTLSEYLQKNNITAEIREIRGSTEIAPGIGLAEAICDLVSSGSTLISNGLREVETVLRSEAVLIRANDIPVERQTILDKLLFRIDGVMKARNWKYILLNAPNEQIEKIVNLLPGLKSPTIVPLADRNWSSIHSVVNESDAWEVIEKLQELGAEGLLVAPIEKMFD